MEIIYGDETGDLGFNNMEFNYFHMVFIVINNQRVPEHVINKLFKWIKKNDTKIHEFSMHQENVPKH